jgi:VanZ family protein
MPTARRSVISSGRLTLAPPEMRTKGLPASGWVLRTGFVCALMAVLIASLWPLDKPPPINTGWDKTDHLVAYLVLGWLGLESWPQPSSARKWIPGLHERRILAGLLAYGGLIELLQGLTETRHADSQDLLANGVGIVLGWLAFRLWNAWGARRRA